MQEINARPHSLESFNAFTPSVHFGEDERSYSPPITYSSRLQLHREILFLFTTPPTAIYTQPKAREIFSSVNLTTLFSSWLFYEFSTDYLA